MTFIRRTKRGITTLHRTWQDSDLRRAATRAKADAMARLLPLGDFEYGQYPHTFLERRPPLDLGGPSELPRRIWAFWTGPNPMSEARRTGLEKLRSVNEGIPVTLVTSSDLVDYVVDGHPLHPAYKHLSYTHRSDYLRAYFLHHFGGGYSDIKPMTHSWDSHFAQAELSRAWLLGAALRSTYQTGNNRGRLGVHMRRHYRRLVEGSAIIVRSHTALTAEWLREVERSLTYAAPALEESPHDERGLGADPGYPLLWMDLLGDILQPLLLKYSGEVLTDPHLWWDAGMEYR